MLHVEAFPFINGESCPNWMFYSSSTHKLPIALRSAEKNTISLHWSSILVHQDTYPPSIVDLNLLTDLIFPAEISN